MRQNTYTIIRILTVILLLTGVSGGGNLAYALNGSGTSADPYTISSEAELTVLIPGVIRSSLRTRQASRAGMTSTAVVSTNRKRV